ncbi:MAG TPA: HypC/HybG/HupF family hydrogenase formation chaperone [Candidatus Cottocaccamicrobium excrementipullorum]|nr:HypC/HybG/HupF family hydrogenase formation chaperone [Candidatus Cottocaccamicrobium excrementipullorum]
MCLAVPLKIVEINGKSAVGEAGGLSQSVRIDFIPDLVPGEYVYVHAGFAIQKMSQQEAFENLALLKEAADEIS